MTSEEKALLLQDLSARLPYGVKFAITNEKTDTLKSIGITKFGLIPINLFYKKPLFYLINEFGNIEYKPYLRHLSSMTEEERKEYKHLVAFSGNPEGSANLVDWLNKKMFAYRTIDGKDMFELGLALETPEGMYT